jgi:TctA family transporter
MGKGRADALLVGAAALLACAATTALGEQPMSPDAVDRQRRTFYAVLAGLVFALTVLSAISGGVVVLFAKSLRTWRWYLIATAISFVALTVIGSVSMVIPAILIFAALAGAGRTM